MSIWSIMGLWQLCWLSSVCPSRHSLLFCLLVCTWEAALSGCSSLGLSWPPGFGLGAAMEGEEEGEGRGSVPPAFSFPVWHWLCCDREYAATTGQFPQSLQLSPAFNQADLPQSLPPMDIEGLSLPAPVGYSISWGALNLAHKPLIALF